MLMFMLPFTPGFTTISRRAVAQVARRACCRAVFAERTVATLRAPRRRDIMLCSLLRR